MRGKRENTYSLKYLGDQKLNNMLSEGKGTSKHADKLENKSAGLGSIPNSNKIYIDRTKNNYMKYWHDYCKSIKESGFKVDGHSPRDFSEAALYMPRYIEEILYPAMEDFALDFVVGKGPSAKSMRLKLQPFTLIGATTRLGSIAAPLRDRFGVQLRLEFYKPEELKFIITRAAEILGVKIDDGGADEIARRSRGTPRIANRLLKRVRDFAQVLGQDTITRQLADEALARLEVDRAGLDRGDRRILTTIVKTFGGGPVGIETIAAAVSEESGTIEDVIEPYLMQLGLVMRTPRGRMLSALGYKHLGLKTPTQYVQPDLLEND